MGGRVLLLISEVKGIARRLYLESYTMGIAELRRTVDSGGNEAPRTAWVLSSIKVEPFKT